MISHKRKKTFRKKTFRKKTFRKKTFRKKTFRKKKNIKRKILKGGEGNINVELYEALRKHELNNVKDLINRGADPKAIVEVPGPFGGPVKSIDMFRITLQNPFNPKWNEINDYLKSQNI